MGQLTTPPQWWEIIVGILSVPAAIIGLFYSYVLLKKTLLEAQKTKLEILEKEKKLHVKKNQPKDFPDSSAKVSVFDEIIVFLLSGLLPENIDNEKSKPINKIFGIIIEFVFLCAFLYATVSLFVLFYAIQNPNYILPSFINIIFVLLILTPGVIIYGGILISDIQGLSNILGRTFEKPKFYSIVVLSTILLQIIISFMIAAARISAYFPNNYQLKSILFLIYEIGFNLSVIPLLLCVVFAFRGIHLLAIILALLVYIFKIFTNRLGLLSKRQRI